MSDASRDDWDPRDPSVLADQRAAYDEMRLLGGWRRAPLGVSERRPGIVHARAALSVARDG